MIEDVNKIARQAALTELLKCDRNDLQIDLRYIVVSVSDGCLNGCVYRALSLCV